MFFYRYDRGPRGRMYGHGGRRELMILGIIALIGLVPIALAVLSGLLIGGMAVTGGLLAAAAGILSALGSEGFSVGSVAVGIVIGLLLYNRKRKEASADRKETGNEGAADTGTQAAEEYYPTDNFRSYGA